MQNKHLAYPENRPPRGVHDGALERTVRVHELPHEHLGHAVVFLRHAVVSYVTGHPNLLSDNVASWLINRVLVRLLVLPVSFAQVTP